MKTYLIILSDIPTNDSDAKFGSFIEKYKLEYWRYTALNWIILTPDDIISTVILSEIVEAYGPIFSCVLDIKINDAFGILPTTMSQLESSNPFNWFEIVQGPKFIPRWLREPIAESK